MKQYLSIAALSCACSVHAQVSPKINIGIYGRAEAVPKNDGFVNIMLPKGGEVSSRVVGGLSLTHAFNTRWQLRFEPGIGYNRYATGEIRRDKTVDYYPYESVRAQQTRIYDKNYLFSLHLPLNATYHIIPKRLFVSSGLETSVAVLNYRKAAYHNFDGTNEQFHEKNWLPGLYALNMPISVGYQFKLSGKLISVEPGINLCLADQADPKQNYNRYSLKLAYYF